MSSSRPTHAPGCTNARVSYVRHGDTRCPECDYDLSAYVARRDRRYAAQSEPSDATGYSEAGVEPCYAGEA